MDKIFFIGIIIGVISRLIMLNLDQKQYPTHPNILASQIVLAFVASSLGALLRKSVVIVTIPLLRDEVKLIQVAESAPVLDTAKGKQSAYKKKAVFFK